MSGVCFLLCSLRLGAEESSSWMLGTLSLLSSPGSAVSCFLMLHIFSAVQTFDQLIENKKWNRVSHWWTYRMRSLFIYTAAL